MIRFVIILICLVRISPSVFCQPQFPKKAVIDNDTVCIISVEQTRTINKVFIDRDECVELKDSLNSQIKTYGIFVGQQKDIISSQETEIAIQNKIITEKNIIIDSDDKILKQQNRQIGWLKIQRTVLGAVVVGLTGVITYHQITK